MLSVLGAGGSIFVVPALIYGLHTTASEATGTSLLVVGGASLVGAVGHWRRGHVHLRVAAVFSVAAMLGAVGGTSLHALATDRVLTTLFAIILFVAAARMAFGKTVDVAEAEPRIAILVPLGLGIGVVSGFLGVGGGFLILPALSLGARLPVRLAIGTSLVVIAASSLTGAATHAAHGLLRFDVLASVGSGALLGALAGAPLAGKIPERPLKRGFSVLAVCVGAYMLVRSLS